MKNRTATQPNPRPRGGRPHAPDRLLSDVLAGATRKETCAVLGLTGPALDGMVRRGCPRNRNGTFDLPEVAQWQRQNAMEAAAMARTDGNSEKALAIWRTCRAAREKLALDRDRSEVVERAEVVEFAGRAVLAVRQRLNDACTKLPPILVGARDEYEVQEVLQAEVDAICEHFARGMGNTHDDEHAHDEAARSTAGIATPTSSEPPGSAALNDIDGETAGTEPDDDDDEDQQPADVAGEFDNPPADAGNQPEQEEDEA